MDGKAYNGWKNRATWNVALWIGNDEVLYRNATAFMSRHPNCRAPYARFIRSYLGSGDRTPDNFKWLGSRLCYRELNAMMRDLIA